MDQKTVPDNICLLFFDLQEEKMCFIFTENVILITSLEKQAIYHKVIQSVQFCTAYLNIIQINPQSKMDKKLCPNWTL